MVCKQQIHCDTDLSDCHWFGIYSVVNLPVDAIPDLSENQVIIFTEWMGRSPQIIEDQVTYPIVSGLQGLPHVKAVRATSMFGMAFVFVVFEDGVDTYFARTRVLERMNTVQAQLPSGVVPSLGRMEPALVTFIGIPLKVKVMILEHSSSSRLVYTLQTYFR